MDPERGIAVFSHICKQLKKVDISVIHNSEMMTRDLFQEPPPPIFENRGLIGPSFKFRYTTFLTTMVPHGHLLNSTFIHSIEMKPVYPASGTQSG